MEVKGWINGDESAREMLARVLTDRPFLLLPPLHRLPLRVGNVVEIVGPSPSAKTAILIQAAVNCILPKEWNGMHYGGLDHLVMYLDLDCHFDILRLSQSLKHRIMEAHGLNSQINGEQNDVDIWNFYLKEEPNFAYNEELFAMCMRRFLYVRCYDSFEFLATLKTMHYQLQKGREAHGVDVHLLMIDSIGAFYWVDRSLTSLAVGNGNRKRLSLQSVLQSVVQEIRNLLQVHPMLVLATKSTISGDSTNEVTMTLRNRSSHGASDFGTVTSGCQKLSDHCPQKFSYREYMPSVWQSFVTHRILVRSTDDNLVDSKNRSDLVYSSEWLLPPLSLVDRFLVRDAGILMVS